MAFSIRKSVPLAIVIPLLVGVGLMGWVAFVNGRHTVDTLSIQNSATLNEQIKDRLNDYLSLPHRINRLNNNAMQQGLINVNDPEALQKHFWLQAQEFPEVSGIEFGYEQDGALRSVLRSQDNSLAIGIANAATQYFNTNYLADARGNPLRILDVRKDKVYNARTRPWYTTAVGAQKAAWTSPFPKFETGALRVSAVLPVYNNNNRQQLVGVLAVDLLLTKISEFLKSLKVGKSGRVFIVERTGDLLATSTEETLFTTKGEGEKFQRMQASNSKDPLIQMTAQHINSRFKGFREVPEEDLQFSDKGELYLVKVAPFTDDCGLDWLVVTVVPEKDFMDGVNQTTMFTLLISLGALAGSVLLGLLATRWLVKPILRLNSAAIDLKAGSFNPKSLITLTQRPDELGELAEVFQDMALELNNREQSLQDQVKTLIQETNQAKKAAIATQIRGGGTSVQALLERSHKARLQAEQKTLKLTDLLRQVTYFQSFTPQQLQELVQLGEKQTFPAKALICQEDEPGSQFYIILAGQVEVYTDKLSKPLNTLKVGSFFGELSLLLGIPRTANVRTLEPTVLFTVDQKGFQKLLHNHQGLSDQVAETLNERRTELEQRKEFLHKHGLLGNEKSFQPNFIGWVRQRLKLLFGL